MPLTIPVRDPPPEHPTILAMKTAFARKGERAVSDPVFRSTLDADWWQHDLKAIRSEAVRLGDDSRLDTRKNTVEFDHSDTYDQRWRFRRWALERSYWLRHLKSVETSDHRLERWEACGSSAHVWKDIETNAYVLRSETCKLRICPACRRRYQFAAIARIRDLLKDIRPKTWQFITLTMRHSRAPLKTQTAFLKSAFRKLRQRNVWKCAVTHGYAVIEVTYNKAKDEWHPHLHILAKCRFIDWRLLRQSWIQVTGGSSIIDCGYVRNQGNACDYVAKYLGKPPNLLDVESADRIQEYYDSIQHARLLMPFGRPPKLHVKPSLDKPRSLIACGSLCDLHRNAVRGDIDSAKIIRALACQADAVVQATDPEQRHKIAESMGAFDPTDRLLPEFHPP